MQLTITTGSDEIYPVETSPDIELENFKALLEFECGIPSAEINLYYNGQLLGDNKKTLGNHGVADGDVLLLIRGQLRGSGAAAPPQQSAPTRPNPMQRPQQGSGPSIDWGAIQIPTNSGRTYQPRSVRPASAQPRLSTQGAARNTEDPAFIRDIFLSDPHQMSLLKERNPRLAEALVSGSLEEFTRVFEEQRRERVQREMERIRMLTADPFNPEVQQRIAEELRMENVNANMETAMEYSPESFGQVFMLYINCKVNGHAVKAFVDSGAQMTIMSASCAERCGVTRLIDHRWSGTAVGVGTQKIIGRVHMCQIQIEKDFLASSFSVLENQPMDMLLGLDMLKRHQCSIDLKKNKLIIGTTGTETPFLPESELPECARLHQRGMGSVSSPRGSAQEEEDRLLAEAMAKSAEEAQKKNSNS